MNLAAKKYGQYESITVDIMGIEISTEPQSVLVTYGLGSCIAVMVYDPKRKVGGMIHYMLPLSSTSPEKAKINPGMFADTGVPLLFQTMYDKGCKKEDLVVKVTGGGKLWDDKGTFDIGKRNYVVLRKLFWKNGIIIGAEDVGGARSRTARLFVDTGRILVQFQGQEVEL